MVDPLLGPNDTTSLGLVDVGTVRESRAWFFALGIAFMALGALAILLPWIASLVTTIVIGWLMVISGLLQGYHAVQNRRWTGSSWALVGAVLHVVAGVLLVVFPAIGTLTLTLILAAFFVANGVLKIIRAVQHRSMPAWGWFLFDGLVSLALGILIGLQWPSTALWALGLLVGIDLALGGSSMLLIGLGARPVVHARARV
jgi:uncharacterized membrane protein HdeD (DUF308 family)